MKQVINRRLIAVYVVIALCIMQDAMDLQMSMFLYYTPNFKCLPNSSHYTNSSHSPISVDQTQCHFTQKNVSHKCTSWRFDRTFLKSTVVTDLQLVCANEHLQLLIVPVRNLAGLTFMLLGFIGDYFGRKVFFVILSCLDSILWFMLALIPLSYPGHMLVRILKSMIRGNVAIGYVIVGELTPIKYRDTFLLNFYMFYGVGIALAPIYMKTMQYWNQAYLLSSLLNIYVLCAPFLLLESPYWLMINGKRQEAQDVLIKLGQLSKDSLLEDEKWTKSDVSIPQTSVRSEFFRYIKCPTLMIRFCILGFTSFVYCLIYNGISTNLNFSIYDIFINAAVLGIIEIPASPLAALLANRIGLNRTIILSGFLAVLVYAISPANYNVGLAASQPGKVMHTILSMLSKLLLIVSWNSQTLLFVALSPTSLRNIILSLFNCIGILGSALGAFIGYYFQRKSSSSLANVPFFVYGATLIGSVVLVHFFIPTVDNVPLPQTVEDCIKINKTHDNNNNSARDLRDYDPAS